MTVRLTIDELVLVGVRPEQAPEIRRTTEQRLTDLLSGRAAEPPTQTASPGEIGGAIAASIWNRVRASTSQAES